MPYRRKTSKTTTSKPAARSYRRRRYRRRPMRLPYRVALPNNMKFKLHYTHTQKLNTLGVGANPNFLLFYPNSIRDCSAASGTQQPYLRDQLYTLYNNCRVIAFSVYVKVVATRDNPIECVLAPARENLADTDIDLAKSRKFAKSCLVSKGETKYLRLKMYVDQYFGQKKGAVFTDDLHVQTDITDLGINQKCPVQLLVLDTLDTLATNTDIVVAQVHINMWCRFENMIDQNLS